MAAFPLNVISMVENVLHKYDERLDQRLDERLSDNHFASRKAKEASLRRNEAAKWLRNMVGTVGGRDLPAEPSEEDFMAALRNGIILCSALNKIQPGAIPKVVEAPSDADVLPDGKALSVYQYFENVRNFLVALERLGLPTFETSDLEQGGISSRVVNCILALKSYNEGKLITNGLWRYGGNARASNLIKPVMSKDPEPLKESFSSANSDPSHEHCEEDPMSSLNTLVHEFFRDKKQEDIPALIESFLGKVMEEFQNRMLIQQETNKITQEYKPSSEAHHSGLKPASDDEEMVDNEDVEAKQEKCDNVKYNAGEERSSKHLKQLELDQQQKESSEFQKQQDLVEQENEKNKILKQQLLAQIENKRSELLKQQQLIQQENERSMLLKQQELAQLENKRNDLLKQQQLVREESERSEVWKQQQLAQLENERVELTKQQQIVQQENERSELLKQQQLAQLENERMQLLEEHQLVQQQKNERINLLKQQLLSQQEKERVQLLKQQQLVEQHKESIQELKSMVYQTKTGMEFLQKKHQEEIIHLGKQLHSIASAASGYQRILEENRKLYNQVQDLKGNIRVYCRVRPCHHNQTSVGNIDEGSISLIIPSKNGKDGKKTFTFNRCFGPNVTQAEVFADTQPLIRSVLDGYNVCIFAYGQTGSGKTHTMSGPNNPTEETVGVNYRALRDLFLISEQRKDTIHYDIRVQMLEIYNETVRDLLSTDGVQKRYPFSVLTKIRNSSLNGINVPDANLVPVQSTADVLSLMDLGFKNRAVSATAMNDRSSRSHSCLTVHVHGKDLTSGKTIRGSIHLVDLAGSERVDKSEVTGDRLKEAQHINKSLAALGDVISSLAQKQQHIPYRNSKLTQLLQDSLGGQAKTLMFVHIAPEQDALVESISTLKFAERVSTIELGAAKVNKDSADVKELKEQIANLKAALAQKDEEAEQFQHPPSSKSDLSVLKSQLSSTTVSSKSGSRKIPRDDSASSLEDQKMESSLSKRRSLDCQDTWINGSPASGMSRNESYNSIAHSPVMLSPSIYDSEETGFTPSESPDLLDMNWQANVSKTPPPPSTVTGGAVPDKLKKSASARVVRSRETTRPTLSPSPSRKASSLPKKPVPIDAKRRTAK
ncbi:hypothetical protein S245_029639 [Arachis hypogaea]